MGIQRTTIMKDTLFLEIVGELKLIHEKFPDLRFGLCIQSALDIHKKNPNSNLHNYSSKVILKALKNFEVETKSKRGD